MISIFFIFKTSDLFICFPLGCLYINSGTGTIQVIYNRNLHKDLGRFLVVISINYNYLETMDPSGKNRKSAPCWLAEKLP